MALLYILHDWSPETWLREMQHLDTSLDLRVWPKCGKVEDIEYALVWKPPPGELTKLPKLKAIFSLGAGVDHIFKTGDLPEGVPVVRVVDPNLTMRMSEYVVLHVLWHHRRQRIYDHFQKETKWRGLRQPAASETRVGVMGMGELGRDAANKLLIMGFNVAGWSQSRKNIDGIDSFTGRGELKAFLNRTDILVSLLPLTKDTRGILNRSNFAELAKDGQGDGAVLINAGRGELQIDADIIAALDEGDLYAATLDVFEEEPLPETSPLWTHPRVTVTPHNSALSDPRAINGFILRQIKRHRAGEPLEHVTDPSKGY
jgi:glyoxylate/hydroxypyruvate reductase A